MTVATDNHVFAVEGGTCDGYVIVAGPNINYYDTVQERDGKYWRAVYLPTGDINAEGLPIYRLEAGAEPGTPDKRILDMRAHEYRDR
jgi:hypothetical protein